MTTLSDEIKVFIVKRLACFDTPTQVAEAVKVNFDIEVSRQLVHSYDPGCAQQPRLRWRELHAATRAKFLSEVSDISVAHKAVRLRILDGFARRAEANKLGTLCATFLEQAAKEIGGIYEKQKVAAAALIDAPPKSPAP